MGALTQNRDQIDIQTTRIDPRGTGVRKQSKVAVRGNPQSNDIILGLKIKRNQSVSEFSFNGRDMTPYMDGPTGRDFARAFAHSTATDETWVGLKIRAGDLPSLGQFSTVFSLEPFNLPSPNFQPVPIVVAYSIAELTQGHYFVGTSYVTGPDTHAAGIRGT